MTEWDTLRAAVDSLTATWTTFDDYPPTNLIQEIAATCELALATRSIADVGRAGRLRAYSPHMLKFIQLRAQSQIILRGAGAR